MAKTYLVDSENIGEDWVDLLDSEEGAFLIFYTDSSPRIDYEHAIKLLDAKNKPKFIRCYKGHNALDFQLVSYLGFLLHSKKDGETIILSKDAGFDVVVDFWKDRGFNVVRQSIDADKLAAGIK